jgi:hypothetical protein
MVQISFLTLSEDDAVSLANKLNEKRLLMFDTIEDHVDLLWDGDGPQRRHLTHLCGTTKALLYSTVERLAHDLLGDRLIRMWAVPVTCLDPKSSKDLMDWIAKV